jgi:uncharacterized protein YndB with AHSA1/START domain
MTERAVVHTTFVIERTYPAPRKRVFNAWADKQAKAKWFPTKELDFRIGGREFNEGKAPNGNVYIFDARYEDIVLDERIVYSYFMLVNGQRMSVSVTTVQFKTEGSGTKLVYTEMGAFLDGLDDPKLREQGTAAMLTNLGKVLEG